MLRSEAKASGVGGKMEKKLFDRKEEKLPLIHHAERRVYHQHAVLYIIKAECFVYHHCESKIQPTADEIHLR